MRRPSEPPSDIPVTPVLETKQGRYGTAEVSGSRRFPASLQDSPDTVMYERTVNSIYDSYAMRRDSTKDGAPRNNGK